MPLPCEIIMEVIDFTVLTSPSPYMKSTLCEMLADVVEVEVEDEGIAIRH